MDNKQAVLLLEEQSQSSLSVKAFCQHKRINYHAFQYWKRKEKRLTSKRSSFIPVQTKSSSSAGKVEVSYPNGIIVSLDSFDTAQIQQLLMLCHV
ncbi:MAG: hypothetical protein M9959_10630 [Chitinophagaceae bacterium]|nr:hypothetical protein [Chitinophagaceae bacterium]